MQLDSAATAASGNARTAPFACLQESRERGPIWAVEAAFYRLSRLRASGPTGNESCCTETAGARPGGDRPRLERNESVDGRSARRSGSSGILVPVTPLFEVNRDSKQVGEIEPGTFPELGLWERQDLEAWVASAPELAGGDFEVVTSEYDRFDRTSERLDVLGVVATEPGHGRLVVVELKRDGMSTTVDLQAIKYAAYVAAAQFSDVVEMYARHHHFAEDEARAALLGLLGGTEEEPPAIDDTPRIVLVAGDFRPEVTTTVMWLIDNFEMDIRCVRLQPFAVGDRILVHSEVIIPLPEAEQYRLGVQRKRREAEQEQKARAGRLLPRLLEAEAVKLGQVLHFRRDAVPPEATPWSLQEPLYQATLVSGEGNRTLEWTDPKVAKLSGTRLRYSLLDYCTSSATDLVSSRAQESMACTTGQSTARPAFAI